MSSSISFIVPAYNVAEYIDACIASLINASQEGDEIIIINDGSTDKTHDICLRWASKHIDKIIYASQSNQGLSAARNFGFSKSKGEYILFIDSDDVLNQESLLAARDVLSRENPDILAMDFLWWRPELNKTDAPPPHSHNSNALLTEKLEFCRETFQDSLLSACSRIFNRRLLNHFAPNIFPIGRFYEEINAIPRITLRANNLYYLRLPLFFYRIRSNSITQKKTPQRCIDLATALRDVIREIKDCKSSAYAELETPANMAAAIYLIRAIRDSGLVEKPSIALSKQIWDSWHGTATISNQQLIENLMNSGWRDAARTAQHLKSATNNEKLYFFKRALLSAWKRFRKNTSTSI